MAPEIDQEKLNALTQAGIFSEQNIKLMVIISNGKIWKIQEYEPQKVDVKIRYERKRNV